MRDLGFTETTLRGFLQRLKSNNPRFCTSIWHSIYSHQRIFLKQFSCFIAAGIVVNIIFLCLMIFFWLHLLSHLILFFFFFFFFVNDEIKFLLLNFFNEK